MNHYLKNQENIKFVLDAMFKSTNEIYGTSYSSRIDNPKYQFAEKLEHHKLKGITELERIRFRYFADTL